MSSKVDSQAALSVKKLNVESSGASTSPLPEPEHAASASAALVTRAAAAAIFLVVMGTPLRVSWVCVIAGHAAVRRARGDGGTFVVRDVPGDRWLLRTAGFYSERARITSATCSRWENAVS